MTSPPGRLRAFAYVTAEKAWLYRAMTGVFLAAKARFGLHLRPSEVCAGLADATLPEPVDLAAAEAALGQLCEWGNLTAHPDTAEVATVEEFYRPRHLYQLTAEGEAAERALAVYDESLLVPGELQAAALADIRTLLGELADLAAGAGSDGGDASDGGRAPDAGKVHLTLTTLRARFDDLTAKAQAFMGSLQRTVDLHGIDVDALVAYKGTLIDYLERFIGELVVTTADIAAAIRRVEERDLDGLLDAAAQRDLVDALAPTDDDLADARSRWVQRWEGLRGWFIGASGRPSQAEILRARARSAIPALLLAVAGANDRRVTRTDRVADLRTLARWFAEADSDADAHRLWRAAFALTPARHLRVDADTLEARDACPVPASTSWLSAPPLRLSPRLRATGRHAKRGRKPRVVDRSAEKALLAELVAAEASQIAAARRRLVTGRPVRLSELDDLDAAEFELFLDLLGDALAGKVRPGDVVETVSADGTVAVTLRPTGDERRAVIVTADGCLSGPDHWLEVSDLAPGHAQAGQRMAVAG